MGLRALLTAFGLIVVGIGCSIVLAGPHLTASYFGGIYNGLTGGQGLPIGFDSADVDSEFRFYSVFWLAFGGLLLRAAFALPQSVRMVHGLMAVFFAGGLFRLLSLWQVGPPHGLFQALMWVELVVPIVLSLLVWISIPRG